MLWVGLLQLVLVALTSAKNVPMRYKRSSVCFNDLGCFSTGPPFFDVYRPISILPESPSFINPKFTLFTRQAPSTGHKLSAGDEAALRGSSFLASRPTKFVVHGFIDNGGTDWMAEMKNEFLTHGDYNVVLVDWGSGSLALYGQATANTRVVGAMIAQLIMFMKNVTGASPEDMHIIGHSLGAHVAGYAGERLTYLGRITGLDPAEPYFQNEDKVVRLDPTDALFVDIIHTDGSSFYSTDLGFGMGQSCGHVDYFPNGGHDQPGCEEGPITHILHEGILTGAEMITWEEGTVTSVPTFQRFFRDRYRYPITNLIKEGIVTGATEFVACNHLRSHHFFTESINSACPFEGYKCDSEDNFNTGGCVPCSGDGCGYMGMNADKVKPRRGVNHVKYYLKTGTHGPYCRYHYRVALTFGGTQRLAHSERGQMYVHLTGSTGETHEVKVTHDNTYVTPGQTYSYLVTAPVDLGVIHDVVFRWDHDSNLLDVGSWNLLGLRHPTLYLDKISVASGESHKTFNFCEHSTAVESNHLQTVSTTC